MLFVLILFSLICFIGGFDKYNKEETILIINKSTNNTQYRKFSNYNSIYLTIINNRILNKIIDTRERSKIRLKELGFEFPDSMSNFIFAKPNKISAEIIFEELKKRKIFVRYWNKPIIRDYLRITVGTDEEMDNLFEALEEIFATEGEN